MGGGSQRWLWQPSVADGGAGGWWLMAAAACGGQRQLAVALAASGLRPAADWLLLSPCDFYDPNDDSE